MPIRHCQKCGLKVLIDESQTGANPFYCQRCTAAMKNANSEASAEPAAAAPAHGPHRPPTAPPMSLTPPATGRP